MWVVKLGGSLLQTPYLQNWLDLLAEPDGADIAIITGGGVFADSVRAAQAVTGLDDEMAHHMAILAMEQYAWLCHGLQTRLPTADSVAALRHCQQHGQAVLLLPARLLRETAKLPACDWTLTSDSIAAWLACEWQAERLVLVKSCAVPAGEVCADELVRAGIVDEQFPRILRSFKGRLNCFTAGDYAGFQALLVSTPGTCARSDCMA